MIAKITGKVEIISPSECTVEACGVGYHLYIPFPVYETLKDGETVSLRVFTVHKEDQFRLYGFRTPAEREFFSILLDISGIGPAMALAIMSGISPESFTDAVNSGRTDRLTAIPGIGKTKAEKIVFEAKRKIRRLSALASALPAEDSLRNDAVEALVSLGYDEKKASAAVDAVQKENPDLSLESVIKQGLKLLSSVS